MAGMPIERLHLAADAGFWTNAARAVRNFAERQGASSARQLQSITWLVPGGAQASLARAALRESLGNVSFIPPRIALLTDWLGCTLAAGTAARAEIFSALRSNAWVREAFGPQPATLWALARDVAQLCDELTLAAVGDADAFDGRLQASLARHFHRRAARALQPQAQLVLQLWRARRSADDGAARVLRELESRARHATRPLVYLGASLAVGPEDDGLAGWETAFLHHYSQHAPVLVIVPDTEAGIRERPLMAAAWPELAAANRDVAIATRADAVRNSGARLPVPLEIVSTISLEEESIAIAHQVLRWCQAGIDSIALVALDRLTARRVRALLERAQIAVRDETGWRLSTTSAAAAVMRWYDLVADDLYWRDLLDWLKSSFTLAGRPNKAEEIFAFEKAIRAGGAVQGTRAIRRALAAFPDPPAAGAREVLALIELQARAARRAGPTLAAHARALQRMLDALGMRSALAADAVGSSVLREVAALESELMAFGGRATLDDFRALLAARFEEAAFIDRQVDSPVVMVSLAATTLRSFDAALLIGADAQHLPSVPTELLFMTNAVRAELGLATAERAQQAQAALLAALLASVPRVVATWRSHRGDEPNPLSPLLERLQFVTRRVLGDDMLREPAHDVRAVDAVTQVPPAPSAAPLLPERVSASHAQSLVDCPYQFYARRLLRLAELDDVIEAPEKRDFGEALHEVLRRFHRAWGATDFSAVDPEQLSTSLREHANSVFAPQIERAPGTLAFERRFDGLVDGYIGWLRQHAASGWRWAGGEEKRSHRIALRDGRTVELTGRLDRIDAQSDEPTDGRLLLLDYKARSASELRSRLKVPGEDVQLPFYGLLLEGRAEQAAYLSFDRAKEGEPGVERVLPQQDFGELTDAVGTRLQSDLQRIAEGAPLPANGAESVCEYCEMRGLCRRDYWKNYGEPGQEGAGG
jgi:ATP-dependent helicase/nuclease subunit B